MLVAKYQSTIRIGELVHLENMLKTRDVAERLGINPKAVRRWINHFSLHCELNDLGHYMINETTYEQLEHIHEQMKLGKSINEVTIHRKERSVPSHKLDERFTSLLLQIDQLDRKLQTKAGEVVEYQLLQHRKEIEEITDSLDKFNERLKIVEDKLNKKAEQLIVEEKKKVKQKEKKGRIASIFG